MNIESSVNVLVVDDIADWGHTIKFILIDEGFICTHANSYSSAIQLLENNEYNLVVLDLRLDEASEDNVDGLKLARIVKSRWANAKIVIITGYGTPDIIQQALESQHEGKKLVDRIINKSDVEEIFETLKHISR